MPRVSVRMSTRMVRGIPCTVDCCWSRNYVWDLTFLRSWGCCWCSGFWRRLDSFVEVSVSEKHTVSFFRIEVGQCFSPNAGIYRRVYTAPKPRNPQEHQEIIYFGALNFFHIVQKIQERNIYWSISDQLFHKFAVRPVNHPFMPSVLNLFPYRFSSHNVLCFLPALWPCNRWTYWSSEVEYQTAGLCEKIHHSLHYRKLLCTMCHRFIFTADVLTVVLF
jgi:hypothetical protein